MVLVVLAGCRDERTFLISDWLEARVKSPMSGIVSISQAVTIKSRGETIVDAQEVYYLELGQSIALRDDGQRRVIVVDHDGHRVDLPCPDGASVAPERFPGIDCWAGHTSDDFAFTRYTANGRVIAKLGVPEVVKACGRVRAGYLGYDARGEPVIAYECLSEGVRMCRATTLGDAPTTMGEIPATTADVACGYLLRTQGRPLGGVKDWSRVGG